MPKPEPLLQHRTCGARTRQGAACRQPAMANGRCRLHGGLATGPRTTFGLERSRCAGWRHGQRSAAVLAAQREDRALILALECSLLAPVGEATPDKTALAAAQRAMQRGSLWRYRAALGQWSAWRHHGRQAGPKPTNPAYPFPDIKPRQRGAWEADLLR